MNKGSKLSSSSTQGTTEPNPRIKNHWTAFTLLKQMTWKDLFYKIYLHFMSNDIFFDAMLSLRV